MAFFISALLLLPERPEQAHGQATAPAGNGTLVVRHSRSWAPSPHLRSPFKESII
jgi:hypothetical protein